MRRERVRGWVRAFAALVAAGTITSMVFAGCDPVSVSRESDKAEVSVELRPDQAVHVELLLPTRFNRRDLERIGSEAAVALFGTDRSIQSSIEPNGAGYPFPVINVAHAYRPGKHPTFTVDTTTLQAVLRSETLPRMSLTVCGPDVPVAITATPPPTSQDIARCAYWPEVSSAPRVVVTMRPAVSHWWAELALVGFTMVASLIALVVIVVSEDFTSRRRLLAVSLALSCLVAGMIGIVTGAAVQGDNLGVHGALSGGALKVATEGMIVVLPLVAASIALLIVALTVRRPRPAPQHQAWSPTNARP